jgi:hypothetical protein
MKLHGLEPKQPGTNGEFVVHVTETNHQWVSEMTHVPLERVKALYDKSVKDGVVCTIEARWDHC